MDYKEKLRLAKEALDSGSYDKETIEYIFPELRESREDEMIRIIKEVILNSVPYKINILTKDTTITAEEAIAWLEKQGEPTVIYNKDNYYSAKEKAWNCKNFSNDINNKVIYIEGFKDGYQFGIHEEKSHRWTLHDEAVRKEAITCLLEWKNKFPSIDSVDYRNIMGWLKDELSVHTEEKQGEQKPILDVEIPFGTDSELVEEAITIPDGCCAIIEDNKVILRKGNKKSSWSEEDEMQLAAAIHLVSSTGHVGTTNWLKSLKDRVHPKQEWSEEDERIKNNLLSELTNLSVRKLIEKETEKKYASWLKSLRPQSTWKPSDEMLEALYRVIPENTMVISEDEMLLDKLYQGLKYGKVLSEK